MSKITNVTDDNFQAEALESDLPVLVDFWAEWCQPCKAIAPVIDELSEEFDGQIKFVKLNTETSHQIPARYGIRGIPTLILFKDGEVVDQIIGAAPKADLIQLLLGAREGK